MSWFHCAGVMEKGSSSGCFDHLASSRSLMRKRNSSLLHQFLMPQEQACERLSIQCDRVDEGV